jgi:photosystem II stability/assembly factor-like uncharacterized protein
MGRFAAALLVLLSTMDAMGTERHVRNLAYGIRDAILVDVAVSPVNPDRMFLGTADGFVFVTSDGGRTWQEFRLLVASELLEESSDYPYEPGPDEAMGEVLPGASEAGMGALDLASGFYFDHGATGDEFLESWDRPSAYDAAEIPGLPATGVLSPGSTGERLEMADDQEQARLVRRIRLQAVLKDLSQWEWGMGAFGDVEELPVIRARVTAIAAHPRNERIALAATLNGVFRTDDGGSSWYPISVGSGRWDRGALTLAFDPIVPERVYLGTQKGVHVSTDGGLTFTPALRTSAETAWTHGLDASASGGEVLLLAATSGNGVLASSDRGRTWRWIRWDGQEDKDYVTCVAATPGDPQHIYMGSLGGIDESTDGGYTWREAGGLQLAGTPVYSIALDPDRKGHLLASTERDVWESDDYGATWRHTYLDDGPFKVRKPLVVPRGGDILVLTSGRLLRISQAGKRPANGPVNGGVDGTWERALDAEPSQRAVIAAVFEHMGVDAGEHRRLRNRASGSHFLPELSLLGGYFSARGNAGLTVTPWLNNAGLGLDKVFGVHSDYGTGYVAAMAWWDLTGLVFSRDEIPQEWGRAALLSAQTSLKYEAVRYYDERLVLMRRLILERPTDAAELLDLALRYRELTEHLDALTGGLYARQVRDLSEGGVEWLSDVTY